ncbi:hypothetical protein SAMN06296273_2807 [Nitrosomonas ureae]|uniref:Uncharacterized protein n=1 Tax=Nitrosomonas ureae TaxID=44577 RepID=A0A285C217_9PROT|nr:hypothetical protein [Nitrosomonas ureae]SNX61355.1 hypothetical protein SAMN06296273_2807 [Nitrosomonas ureae]
MKRIFILKTDDWINILNWAVWPFFVIYIISMVVCPFIVGKGELIYVQSVWHSWQSLNVGILAFTSSLIAFNISRYNAKKQSEREFVAARAFLPETLSELTSYFQQCSPLLKEAWDRANNAKDKCKTPLKKPLPKLPCSYKKIFSRCIVFSKPDFGEHLACILTRLQIHHSRLQSLENEFSESSNIVQIPQNIVSYMYSLGELQALVNRIFEFSRGREQFDGSPLKLEEFRTAYFGLGLDIPIDLFDNLFYFTQQRLVEKS